MTEQNKNEVAELERKWREEFENAKLGFIFSKPEEALSLTCYMAVDACKNSDNVDFSLVPEFSKYYESVRNHHWMVFRPECKTHLFAYKAYVQGRRESELKMKAREAKLVEALKTADNILMSFDEYRDATDRKETSKSNTKWHTFERILYDTIKLGWNEARKVLKDLEIEL